MKFVAFWRFWLPPLLYLALIFALSSLSSPPVPPGISGDSLHYPEYAVLGFLLARALYASFSFRWPLGAALVSLACSTAWGATDEFHQAFVPGRVPDLGDLAHDAIGAVLGTASWLAWNALYPRLFKRAPGP